MRTTKDFDRSRGSTRPRHTERSRGSTSSIKPERVDTSANLVLTNHQPAAEVGRKRGREIEA